MSRIVQFPTAKSLTPCDYLPKEYIEAAVRGEEAGIAAVDAIRAGADPDVFWVNNVDEVFGELDKHPEWGRGFLNGFIQSLLEEIK